MNLLRRLTAPGILRLYLAATVVAQHLGIPWIGTLAVLLFFILSGYWITTLWKAKYRRCASPYRVFIISRYWRLLPVYLTCVILAGFCIWRFSGWWGSWTTHFSDPRWVLSNLFILGCASAPRFLVPAWSLDVEMQFYILAPLVIALTALFSRPRIGIAIALPVFALCITAFLLLPLGWNVAPYLLFFATGCAISHARWKPSATIAFPCAVLAIAVCVATLRIVHPSVANGAATAYADGLLLPSLIFVALAVPFIAWSLGQKSDRLDRTLGDLAYPVYLFHFIPFLMLDHIRIFSAMPAPARIAADILIVAIGSLAIYWIIDRPFERARRAYTERQLRAASTQTDPLTPAAYPISSVYEK